MKQASFKLNLTAKKTRKQLSGPGAQSALFVRSLTALLVHKGTLEEYVYLEYGAHFAVGILALIMLASVQFHISEWFTGLSGVAFIGLSLWSSIRHMRQFEVQVLINRFRSIFLVV